VCVSMRSDSDSGLDMLHCDIWSLFAHWMVRMYVCVCVCKYEISIATTDADSGMGMLHCDILPFS
jgi:hypothetical protein